MNLFGVEMEVVMVGKVVRVSGDFEVDPESSSGCRVRKNIVITITMMTDRPMMMLVLVEKFSFFMVCLLNIEYILYNLGELVWGEID